MAARIVHISQHLPQPCNLYPQLTLQRLLGADCKDPIVVEPAPIRVSKSPGERHETQPARPKNARKNIRQYASSTNIIQHECMNTMWISTMNVYV